MLFDRWNVFHIYDTSLYGFIPYLDIWYTTCVENRSNIIVYKIRVDRFNFYQNRIKLFDQLNCSYYNKTILSTPTKIIGVSIILSAVKYRLDVFSEIIRDNTFL